MSKVVLCIDNKNPYLEETKNYLRSQDYIVYTLSGESRDIKDAKDINDIKDMNDSMDILREIEQKEGHIDILLFGVDEQMPQDGTICEKHDWEAVLGLLSEEINRTQETIEAALPLLRKGKLKRIGMITKMDSSIRNCGEDDNYGQHMVGAGLNMLGKLYFNLLRPEGFTFRWYCAGEKEGGMSAGEYLLSNLCYDAKEPYIHSDENRLVMRDSHLREIPW